MRSEGNDAVVDCEDPMTVIACTTDTDACPAKCKENTPADSDEIVKSGDLAVTATPASERKAIIGAISDLDTLKFRTSEEVTISKLVLERYGYSKGADVSKVWLEDENGNKITSEKGVNSRDQVELTFKKDYKVVDGVVNATIVVELNDPVTTWGTIGFKVISATSTAENQELDKSGYTPYTYDMVGYDAVKVSIDAKGNPKDYNYEEGEMYEVAKFKLKAGTSPLLVNGVTLTNEYTPVGDRLDLKDFVDKVEVLANGEKVSGVEFNINKKTELVVSFDSVEVAAKENATFAVNMSLAGFDQYGQWVQFSITGSSDVKIQEKKTGARVSVTLPTAQEGEELWASHKFVGSKIKLSNKKLWNLEYAAGSSDVVVAEGTLTISEAVELADGKYEVKAQYEGEGVVTGVVEAMRLVIAGEEFEADLKASADNEDTFSFSDVEITKWGKVQIKVDLNRDAKEGVKVTFVGDFDEAAFVDATYPDGDDSPVNPDEISGTISFSKLTVQASKAALSNDIKDPAEFKDNETSEEVEVLKWTYTAKKGNIILSDFVVEAADTTLDLWTSKVTFYLYINGSKTPAADVRLSGNHPLKGSDSFGNVRVDAGESVDVIVTAEVSAKNLISEGTSNDLGRFKITLNWEDADGNQAWEASRNTIELSVVKAGSIIIDNTSKDKTLLLAESDTELASFNVKPDGAATDLETLKFTIKGPEAPTKLDEYLVVEVAGEDMVEAGYCTIASSSSSEDVDEPEAGAVESRQVICEDMAERVSSATNVKIALVEDADATDEIELTVNQINNDEAVSKTFKKKFVPVLVTFTKQVFGDVSTKYTINVSKKWNKTAENLKFYVTTGTTCDAEDPYRVIEGTISASNNPLSITNGASNLIICKITYSVDDTDDVIIEKSEFPDYFDKIPTEGSKSSTEELMVRKTTD